MLPAKLCEDRNLDSPFVGASLAYALCKANTSLVSTPQITKRLCRALLARARSVDIQHPCTATHG